MRGARWVTGVFVVLSLAACSGGSDGDALVSDGAQSASSPSAAGEDDVVVDEQRASMEAFAACLQEAGFATEMRDDGGVDVPAVPSEQQGALDQATEVCLAGQERTRGRIPGEEELSVFYDLLLEGRECLLEAGYSVEEAPTREKFIADYRKSYSGEAEAWSPWSELNDPESIEVCVQPSEADVMRRMLDADQGDSR